MKFVDLWHCWAPLGLRRFLFDIRRFPAKCYCLFIIYFFNKASISSGNIIIVFVSAGLGDFILWLDSAKELKPLFYNKKLVLICDSTFYELASRSHYFDSIYTIEPADYMSRNIFVLVNLRKKLSSISAEKAIQCFSNRWIWTDFIMASISASQKIGLDAGITNSSYITLKSTLKIYDKIFAIDKKHTFEHALKINNEFLAFLGRNFSYRLPVIPNFSLKTELTSQYYIIHLGASSYQRAWGIEKFAEIADYIFTRTNIVCCICGSKEEKIYYEKFIKNLTHNSNIIDYTGKTSITEFIELIRGAKFVIGNDTSTVHIATAVKTPSICILGPWEFGRYLPYPKEISKNYIVPILVYADMPCKYCQSDFIKDCIQNINKCGRRLCMDIVSVNDVKIKIDALLSKLEL